MLSKFIASTIFFLIAVQAITLPTPVPAPPTLSVQWEAITPIPVAHPCQEARPPSEDTFYT
ncbi:hypothetical protein B0H14DRAFT_3516021 [Mycena olivaceomarginata]|nr:hypothetical protein B0H14DRAFT_3516021 [Mycena olivaceomarginata]